MFPCRILSPTLRQKLRERLDKLARADEASDTALAEVSKLRQQIAQLTTDLAEVEKNMAMAETKKQFAAISGIFDNLVGLPELAKDESHLGQIGELFRAINVRVFFSFKTERVGKRDINRVSHVVITFCDTPACRAL
jgi:hypothetical protein